MKLSSAFAAAVEAVRSAARSPLSASHPERMLPSTPSLGALPRPYCLSREGRRTQANALAVSVPLPRDERDGRDPYRPARRGTSASPSRATRPRTRRVRSLRPFSYPRPRPRSPIPPAAHSAGGGRPSRLRKPPRHPRRAGVVPVRSSAAASLRAKDDAAASPVGTLPSGSRREAS